MKSYGQWTYPVVMCTVLLSACAGVGPARPLEPPKPLPGPQLVLDPDFGDGGEVTSDLGQSEDIAALALQDDGKIVAVGGSFREDTQSSDLVLARYLPSGDFDTSFGTTGYIFTPTGPAETAPSWGSFEVVTLQDDGKILVAGYAALNVDEHYTPGTVLARYNPDGSLDPSFGVEGFVRSEPGTGTVTGLELQPDGKIVIAASGWSTNDVSVTRYTPDGQVDPSFGTGGVVTLPVKATAVVEEPDLLQTADGGFVLALDTRLVRLNADGSRAESFGEGGEIDTGYAVQALAQQEDGSIVVSQVSEPEYGNLSAQVSDPAPTDFRMTRYTSEGELDASFGDAGVVITDINRGEEIWGLSIQSDGKIIAAGRTQDAVAVVRYTVSGEVDASFVGAFSGAYALALDDQNRIFVGGYRLMGDAYDFALARLLP